MGAPLVIRFPSHDPVSADGFIWFDFNTAAVSDGTLEVRLQINVAPGEDDLYT